MLLIRIIYLNYRLIYDLYTVIHIYMKMSCHLRSYLGCTLFSLFLIIFKFFFLDYDLDPLRFTHIYNLLCFTFDYVCVYIYWQPVDTHTKIHLTLIPWHYPWEHGRLPYFSLTPFSSRLRLAFSSHTPISLSLWQQEHDEDEDEEEEEEEKEKIVEEEYQTNF